MADILLDVKVQGTQEVLKAQGAMSSVTSAAAKLASEMDKGRLTSQAYFKGQTELVKVLTQAGFSYTQAKKAVFDYTKALRDQAAANAAADAAKKLADRNEYLRRTYQQGYAAFARARTQMRELREAMRNGIITTEQYRAAVQRLREEQARQNAQGNRNTRGMGQSSTMIQQAGYQFGDFAVQVQSGTNAFVAFGQQATQLAGTLTLIQGRVPLLGISYLALGTALGVVIPLVTAYLAYTQRASGATKKLKDSLDDLNETNKLLEDFGKNFGKDLIGNIEAVRKAFGDLVADVYEAQIKQVQTKLKGLLSDKTAVQATQIQITDLESLAPEQLQKQLQQVLFIKEQFARLTATEVTSQSELNALYDDVYQTLKNSGQINESGLAVLRSIAAENGIVLGLMQSQVDESEEQAKYLRTQVSHQQQIATIQKDINDQRAEYREAVNQAENSLKQQIALNMKILQYGENSLEVERLKAEQAREAYRQELLNDGSRGNHLTKLMELYDRQVKLEGKVSDTADEAERFSTILEMADLSHLVDQSASLAANMADAADNAAAALAARTLDVANAANIQYAGRGTTSSRPAFQMDDQGRITTVSSILRDQESARKKAAEGSSKQSPTEQAEEYIQKLEREAEFKSTLVGLSDEQAAIETRREQLVNQLNGYEEGLSDTYTQRIEQIIKTEAETRKLMEAEKQREQLMNTIEGHIENAFMSMVDGSKSVEDAFKSMLRNIILAIYQEKVAKPAAQAIGGWIDTAIKALVSANGNVISNGMHVKAYADGGVVNRATMFPMRSGVGIMGEAGPEAIMPLKRGKNGKLGVQMEGNSGNVTVVQNFNMSANGDESVKRIIRQETPRIAEQAKAAVVDAKRRGGSYGRSF